MNQMWNANVQRTIGKNLLLEVAYVGSRGEHIWNNYTRNATSAQYLSLGTQLNSLVANPFYGKITSGSMSAAQVRLGLFWFPIRNTAESPRSAALLATPSTTASPFEPSGRSPAA
jgi:hypothetical protein